MIINAHERPKESSLSEGFAIVADIGKTTSKVTLWSRAGALLDRQVRANQAVRSGGLARLDVSGISAWLVEALSAYRGQPIDCVIPVGHGAGVVAMTDGKLAFPPLDYEQPVPAAVLSAYRRERDAFALTGSPPLPDGLNLGAQLHWLEDLYPKAMARATLLPWAQYWAWFLSGCMASEATSLGCHSDLWEPAAGRFSPLAIRRGWAERFAPLALAGDVVGTLTPALAERTGLPRQAKILAGLHDSNAALLAARGFDTIAQGEATVLSTGTWFIAMRVPAAPVDPVSLPAARDCLVNVDAYGRPVPSTRFMGGRELELLTERDGDRIDIAADQADLLAAVPQILQDGAMVLPTLTPGCGPFPQHRARWIDEPQGRLARRAAAALYAALVADAALDLIGARARLLIEGRFAGAAVFVRALAALRPDTAVYTAPAQTDVSFGTLRLIDPDLRPHGDLSLVAPLPGDMAAYRTRWRSEIGG